MHGRITQGVEPGTVDLVVGLHSADHRLRQRMQVTGDRRSLEAAERTFFSTVEIESVIRP